MRLPRRIKVKEMDKPKLNLNQSGKKRRRKKRQKKKCKN